MRFARAIELPLSLWKKHCMVLRALKVPSVSAAALPPPSPAALEAATELTRVTAKVSSAEQDRLSYSRDMWPLALMWIRQGRIPPPPDLVVWPRSIEEVVEVVKLARRRKLAVIPFGAGSGVCGATWALQGGIALDMKHLDA